MNLFGLFLCIFCCVELMDCSHFRGALFSWAPAPDGNIAVCFRISWRKTYSGYYCDDTTIKNQTLTQDSSSKLCSNDCNYSLSLNYYCTDYSDVDKWTSGRNCLTFTPPKPEEFNLTFSGNAWVHGVGWNFVTTVDLTARKDNGELNNSPTVEMAPVINVQRGCDHTIDLPVGDVDGDMVRCRWAIGTECGGVCYGATDKALPGAILYEDECRIAYSANDTEEFYAVAIQVEDFMNSSPQKRLSSVPVQFLVKLYDSQDPLCANEPEFTPPTPDSGECFVIGVGEEFNVNITVKGKHNLSAITTTSAMGMEHSKETRWMYDSWYYMSLLVSWIPTQEDADQDHNLCFYANDENGIYNTPRCINVPVAVSAPVLKSLARVGVTNTWILTYDRTFSLPANNVSITVMETETDQQVFTMDTGNTNDVVFYPDNKRVHVTLTYTFDAAKDYYVNVPEGLVRRVGNCNALSPAITDKSVWKIEIDCGNIDSIDNGIGRTPDGTDYPYSAEFECNEGYKLYGDEKRQCLDNGTWGGIEPHCEVTVCVDLTAPVSGTISSSTGTTYASIVEFQCNDGHLLIGTKTTKCTLDAVWSTAVPTCLKKVDIGAPCSTSDICRPRGAQCINSTCACETGIYNTIGDACDAMNLYPYGTDNGDVVMDNTDDFCSLPIANDLEVPIFDDRIGSIYVCSNGILSAGKGYQNTWPSRNFGNNTVFAPFFADSNGGEIYYRTYDILNNTDGLRSVEVMHVESMVKKLASLQNFNTVFILFATWDKVRASQDGFDKTKVSTFQLVLVTDGSHTFAFFIYGLGLMQWSWSSKSQLGPAVWIGYSSSQKYNFTNILSFKSGVTQMDIHARTQGITGLLFNRLTSIPTRPPSDMVICSKWYNTNRHLKDRAIRIADQLPKCPCDEISRWFDSKFVPVDDSENVSSQYSCVRMKPLSQFRPFGKTCCYDKKGQWIGELPHSGHVQLYSEDYPAEHLINDIDAKKVCCKNPFAKTCQLYYELHPIGKCYKKSDFKIGGCHGDPHFVTPDGMNFTFNGYGEYTLLSINTTDNVTGVNITFDLQARTDPAIREDGTLSYATRFRAFAAKDHTNASFYIELSDAQDGYTLFANGADLSLKFRGNSGTRSIIHKSSEGNMVLTKRQNVLAVLFPQTDISMNVTIGERMLSLSLTINDRYKSMTRGLLGNSDGDPSNDFVTPSGETLPYDMSEDQIFDYGQLWEIDPENSAFVYPAGNNHSNYHNSSHVPKFLNTADADTVQEAYVHCEGPDNMQCVFDYVFTGDIKVAANTKRTEREMVYIRKTNNQTVPTVDVCDMVFVNKGEEATCTISIGDDPEVHVNVTKTSPRGNITYNHTNKIVRFIIDDTTPDIISVTVTNDDERSTEANITVVLCSGCSQHGVCVKEVRDDMNQTEHFKFQMCKCEPQYEGIDCDLEVDGCQANPCSSLRNCTKLTAAQQKAQNVSHLCGPCPVGFEEEETECKDIDECSSGEDDCQQICVNSAGSYECSCYPGYRISSYYSNQCLDINECDEALHTCSHICNNEEGNYSCSCFYRYVLNETTGKCALENDTDICADAELDCSKTSGCTLDGNGDATCFCETGLILSGNGTGCTDIDECDQNVCPQACINTPGSFKCECYPGYNFTNGECTQCVFPTWGNNCDNECNCSSNTFGCDPAFGCMCSPGWHGDLCEVDIDECEEFPCANTLQECVNVPGGYKCDCINGYEFSEDKQLCTDIDECSRPDLHNCSQTCTNNKGSYSCSCIEGFVLYNETLCRDIDDCDLGTSNCEQICDSGEFNAGSYNCYCHYGYLINDDRRTCRKDPNVRELCEDNHLKCSHFCKPDKNPKHSKCQCKKGYKLAVDLQTCLDIDECTDPKLNKCDDSAECSNKEGSYECECPIGTMLANNQRDCQVCDHFHYGKDCANECNCIHGTCNTHTGCQCDIGWSGKHCDKDIDECAIKPCPGSAGMECSNNPGSYVCQCKAGYFQNESGICSDIDECEVFKLSKCDQKCLNSPGSYRCECAPGFKYVNGRCEDLDECSGVSKCDHYCNNTIGSYRCTCSNGFKLDKTNRQSCKPEMACTADNITYCDTNNASCVMINGTPECICDTGYEKETDNNDLCVDIKECSEIPMRCQEHECVELEGGFKCQCTSGHYLLDDGVSCQVCNATTYGLNCNNTCVCDLDNTVTCDPENGSCLCKAGWEGDTCDEDINECTETVDACVDSSVCMNTNGSYVCECDIGYIKTGFGECEVCDPQRYGKDCLLTCECDMEHTAVCHNGEGACECMEGWKGDNCTENIIECDNETICTHKANSDCVDTLGSYICRCEDGYLSQNGQCIEIDECFDGSAECDQACVNSDGSFYCRCYLGYKGYWNTCDECSDNTFGFNCSETCTCNITNSLHSVQTCVPANGTCVCRDEWTGTTCDDDVDECREDEDVCEDIANTGCYNTIEGYTCLCLRGFERNDTEGPCEEVVQDEHTTPIGWDTIPFSVSLDVPLSPGVDLKLASVFMTIERKVITALENFTKRYTNNTFVMTVNDMRKGSLEVDYQVSYDGNVSDIGDQLAYAAIDLATGQEIVYDGKIVSVKSKQFDNGTDACLIYTNILNNCNSPYECVKEDGRPVCRLKTYDTFGLIFGLSVGLGFTVLVIIAFVFCGCKLRQATTIRKQRKKELLSERLNVGSLEGWQYDGRAWSPIMASGHLVNFRTSQHQPNLPKQYSSSRHADHPRSQPRHPRSSHHNNFICDDINPVDTDDEKPQFPEHEHHRQSHQRKHERLQRGTNYM